MVDGTTCPHVRGKRQEGTTRYHQACNTRTHIADKRDPSDQRGRLD